MKKKRTGKRKRVPRSSLQINVTNATNHFASKHSTKLFYTFLRNDVNLFSWNAEKKEERSLVSSFLQFESFHVVWHLQPKLNITSVLYSCTFIRYKFEKKENYFGPLDQFSANTFAMTKKCHNQYSARCTFCSKNTENL